ncbi:MAG: hypothetical protein PVG39_00770 [Desulfobacteraceae bacterium]|jgi:hypothetical protein
MSDKDIGHLMGQQEALEKEIANLRSDIKTLFQQQECILRKLSGGKGFLLGILVMSGGVGAAVASLFAKITGGSN